MFVIEDERHAEIQGRFPDRQSALAELRRRAIIPWDQEPNTPPCTNWHACGRVYELIEYDDSTQPWAELSRVIVLEVSATGARWVDAPQDRS